MVVDDDNNDDESNTRIDDGNVEHGDTFGHKADHIANENSVIERKDVSG